MLPFFTLLASVNSFLCISLGIFTLSRNPKHPTNVGFLMGMAGLATIEAGNALILFNFKSGVPPFAPGIRLSAAGLALLPVLWLPFSLTFARADFRQVLKKWKYALCGLFVTGIVMVSLIYSDNLTFSYSPTSLLKNGELVFSKAGVQLPSESNYFYLLIIIGLVLNLVQLENTFRASAMSRRWQIKYTVFGVSSILAFFIYLSCRGILFLNLSFQLLPALSIVVFVSTVMMLVFIVRHRLMDVDIFVSRYVVYNSFTVLTVGIYMIAVGGIAQLIKHYKPALHEFYSTAFVFVSILIVIVLGFTEALRRRIKLFINRNFYKHKYEFRDKWMESINKISSLKTSDETCTVLLDMVEGTVPSDGLSLWLYDHSLNSFQHFPDEKSSLKSEVITPGHPLIKRIKQNGYPFCLNQAASTKEKKITKTLFPIFLDAKNASLCVPLIADSQVVGFLLLGKDISGCTYVDDDFQILHAIATQTAVQLKNLKLAHDLAAAKEVEAFHRLSSFIIHDLKNLTNSLSLISQNAQHCLDDPEFQKDAMATIDHTVSRMKGLIKKFSSLPRGVEIEKKKVDIHRLIKNVLQTMQFSDEKNIAFSHIEEPTPPLFLDPDAMEMVFTNILSNAYDSIKESGNVEVKSLVSERGVSILISDTGSGMSEEFLKKKLFRPFNTTKKSGFGIGLFQCKEIIEAHEGTLEVESFLGKGTVFTVTLP